MTNVDELKFARIAEAAHEVNRSYCLFSGDSTLKAWWDLPQPARLGYTAAVRGILTGQFPTPESQHVAWMESRFAEGWIWAPELDRDKKMHPNLRPYAELPENQRAKDTVFRAVVIQSARLLGVEVPQ